MRGDARRERARGLGLARRAAEWQARGEVARAEGLYERAIALLERAAGPGDPELGRALTNFGLLRKSCGDLDAARKHYERALPLLRQSLGAAHADVATLLHNLAMLLKAQAAVLEQRSRAAERDARELARLRSPPPLRADLARHPLVVRPSAIHRFGVFAARAIPANEDILEYTGERIARREAVRRWNADRTYLVWLDAYWRIDGSVGGSGAELVNHCCTPNVRMARKRGHVWLHSRRRIRAGEELVLDYRFPKDSPRIPCYCGSPACRGTINER
jgi:tetratricopeptide (TPR) repeat protein